jgi:CRP-like cAMP-binding protein
MSTLERFRKYIADRATLSPSDWAQVEAMVQIQYVAANDFVLREGEVCRHLYFLDQGLLRFFQWIDGEDRTKFFTYEQQLFTAQQSFSTQQPTRENVQALENSTLLFIAYEQVQQLRRTIPVWSAFTYQVMSQVNVWTDELLVASLNETAESRYRRMLNEQPERLRRIPIKHLASYLGIAPESLSRIRRKVARPERT